MTDYIDSLERKLLDTQEILNVTEKSFILLGKAMEKEADRETVLRIRNRYMQLLCDRE